MTTTMNTDQRFAWVEQHGGPVVGWADPHSSYRHDVVGEGMTGWFASDRDSPNKALSISKHVEDDNGKRMLELRLASQASTGDKPVLWNSTLMVGKGRYVRVHGSAADFTSALALVESHAHESRLLGALTWWRESEHRWVSWLGAFDLATTKITPPGGDAYWHFEIRGDAPTLEEAALLAGLGRQDPNAAVGGQDA